MHEDNLSQDCYWWLQVGSSHFNEKLPTFRRTLNTVGQFLKPILKTLPFSFLGLMLTDRHLKNKWCPTEVLTLILWFSVTTRQCLLLCSSKFSAFLPTVLFFFSDSVCTRVQIKSVALHYYSRSQLPQLHSVCSICSNFRNVTLLKHTSFEN